MSISVVLGPVHILMSLLRWCWQCGSLVDCLHSMQEVSGFISHTTKITKIVKRQSYPRELSCEEVC